MIEKQYRNRLNGKFHALLLTLPSELTTCDSNSNERKVSKAETLALAQRYIRELEAKGKSLETRNDDLKARIQRLEKGWLVRGVSMP
jgi:hypothetical protein